MAAAPARGIDHAREALDVARRLPEIAVSAREAAAGVVHGIHGRRRAGVGEAFWQFRPFTSGESATRIDWRRSARDDRTYVREREWEAAQTVWIWIDRSPSMAFRSALARASKLHRALVLGLAAADLMVRGGERAGLLGLTRPVAARNIVDRFAEALSGPAATASAGDELPAAASLPARSRALVIGDLLSDAAAIRARLGALAAEGALGHVVAVCDPVEETFPFAGHVELADTDGPARMRLGDAAVLREGYTRKLAAHRDSIAESCRGLGWTFAVHRTDRPASEPLLRLAALLADGAAAAPNR